MCLNPFGNPGTTGVVTSAQMGNFPTVLDKRFAILIVAAFVSAVAAASGWHHHEGGADNCLACALAACAAVLVAVAYARLLLAPAAKLSPCPQPQAASWPATRVYTRGPPR